MSMSPLAHISFFANHSFPTLPGCAQFTTSNHRTAQSCHRRAGIWGENAYWFLMVFVDKHMPVDDAEIESALTRAAAQLSSMRQSGIVCSAAAVQAVMTSQSRLTWWTAD
eukprot:2369334-Amphidinium_carterae.1